MKLKTKSGAKKRIKVRKSGSLKANKPCMNHLLTNKSKKQKHSLTDGMPVHHTHLKVIRKVLPGMVAGK